MGILGGLLKPDVGKLRSRRDVDRLCAALGHKDAAIRRGAAWSLGELADGRAVEALIGALGDVDEGVGEGAAQALGQMHDERAVGALAGALRHRYRAVRVQAGSSLIRLGRLDLVVEALGDADEGVRKSTIWGLGQSGDPEAVARLIKVLESSDPLMRAEAADALRQSEAAAARAAVEAYDAQLRVERTARLEYVVGRQLGDGRSYRRRIGTEPVGYFDPLKVAFRIFDERGLLIKDGGKEAVSLVWPPPCLSDREQASFMISCSTLAQALEAYPARFPALYLVLHPLGELDRLVHGLRQVASGEVNQFIQESTVLPFFRRNSVSRYSVSREGVIGGAMPWTAKGVASEVRLNALLNFLSTLVRAPGVEDIGVSKFRRRAIEAVRQIKASGCAGS